MKPEDDRYHRHRILKEIGPQGLEKLAQSSVLIVGCGALGSIQAQLLARSGVGTIRIVDSDVPDLSNLQRQLLYDENDVAEQKPKAEIAATKLAQVNSTVRVEGHHLEVKPENIEALVSDIDLVLDASDNFKTRYIINDACVKNQIPWIYGGVIAVTGMFLTILPGQGPCLRCIFPESPHSPKFPSPETEGILNTLPITIGALQTTEAIRLLMGKTPDQFPLVVMDLWSRTTQTIPVPKDSDCPCCGLGRFDFLV